MATICKLWKNHHIKLQISVLSHEAKWSVDKYVIARDFEWEVLYEMTIYIMKMGDFVTNPSVNKESDLIGQGNTW